MDANMNPNPKQTEWRDLLLNFPAGEYNVLQPKALFHADRVEQMLRDPVRVTPVTVQIGLTLECSHMCWFCTYGQVKPEPLEMQRPMLMSVIEQLAASGVKGVTFTGGGEPTLHPDLVDAMALCRARGLDFALFTNGTQLTPELAQRILRIEPVFVRVSLNAGTPETEIFATMTDDFDRILDNLKSAAQAKLQLNAKTDLNIGFVFNVLNVDDLPALAQTLRTMILENGLQGGFSTLQIRPTMNYPSSRFTTELGIGQSIRRFLEIRDRTYGTGCRYRDEFDRYYVQGSQLSPWVIERALNAITNEVIPLLADTGLRVIYPRQKFLDLAAPSEPRPYDRCAAAPWILFIWPDGKVYGCIEWAGAEGMEIGDLSRQGLTEILASDRRREFHQLIDSHKLHTECPLCAQHEPNMLLNGVLDLKEQLGADQVMQLVHAAREQMGEPPHKNFV